MLRPVLIHQLTLDATAVLAALAVLALPSTSFSQRLLVGSATGPDSGSRTSWSESVRQTARRMADSLRAGDLAGFDSCFAVDQLIDRTLEGFDLTPAARLSLSQGIRNTFTPGRRLKAATRRGSFRFLSLRQAGGALHGLFRVLGEGGTLSYWETIFAPLDGVPRVVDFFDFNTGELHSQTIRRILVVSGVAVLGSIGSEQTPSAEVLAQLGGLHGAFRKGEFARAARLHDALPPAVRQQKCYLLMRIECGARQGRSAHLKALSEYARLVPKSDPSRALVLMDLFLLRDQVARAVESLDTLASRVGDDPYLKTVRARLMVRLGKLAEARRDAAAAIAAAPGLAQGYIAMLSVCLLQGDYQMCTEVLDALDRRFTIRREGLGALAGFRKFADSALGRDWLADFDVRHMHSSTVR